MPQYLTNLERTEENQHRASVASLRSGQDVKYIDAPMPPDSYDPWYDLNFKSGDLNHLGSLWAVNNEGDYSTFWKEWRRLGNESY